MSVETAIEMLYLQMKNLIKMHKAFQTQGFGIPIMFRLQIEHYIHTSTRHKQLHNRINKQYDVLSCIKFTKRLKLN